MTTNTTFLTPDLVAPSLHSESDKPSISGIFFMEIYKNLNIKDIDGEIWKPVLGYEGKYEISNMGRLKALMAGKFMYKPKIIVQSPHYKRKYLMSSLYKNNKEKKVLIHRLVALHFIPNPDNLPQVNHRFGDKFDNCVISLEWINNSENQKHSYRILGRVSHRKGMTGSNCGKSKPIKRISKEGVIMQFESTYLAAKYMGVSHSGISAVARGKQKTAYGYKWEYLLPNNERKIL